MNILEFIRLLDIIRWPVVALVFLFIVRPHLAILLSGAKVKLAIAGQSIETTLPELKQVLEEHAGESLSDESVTFLTSLQQNGAKQYHAGIDSGAEVTFLRPLRNAGLILTVPRNSFLSDARSIELSALGRLYLRAKSAGVKS